MPRYNNPCCPLTKLILDWAAGMPSKPGLNSQTDTYSLLWMNLTLTYREGIVSLFTGIMGMPVNKTWVGLAKTADYWPTNEPVFGSVKPIIPAFFSTSLSLHPKLNFCQPRLMTNNHKFQAIDAIVLKTSAKHKYRHREQGRLIPLPGLVQRCEEFLPFGAIAPGTSQN